MRTSGLIQARQARTKRRMKAYPSDLEHVVQRLMPMRDWPVIADHLLGATWPQQNYFVRVLRLAHRPNPLASRVHGPTTLLQASNPCGPQKQRARLSGILHQAILMMQAAKHRRLHNAVAACLVPVGARWNFALVGFRGSRAE